MTVDGTGTRVDERPFGRTDDGTAVSAFDLVRETDTGEVRATVLSYGGRLQSLVAPDRDGRPGEITLGYDDLAGYLADTAFLGATVGRFANRIADARFALDGTVHELPANDGSSSLHGGPDGFHARVWVAEPVPDGVALRLHSPDGDAGYPGALEVVLTVRLDATGLWWEYRAVADAPTVVNLTNHAYWNLAGSGTVADHLLEVAAGTFLPVDERGIPLDGPAPVEGSPLDLRRPVRVGDVVAAEHPQLRAVGGGVDHCYVVDGRAPGPGGLPLVARLADPGSGRTLTLASDEPGVQVYTGVTLDGTLVGRGGRTLHRGAGLCLETQHWPDSPNRREFPSTVLRPGDVLTTRTVVALGVG
ncbi:aldose epimerase family protein [Aquipuribacter nitratireducens]|uniref:Aldose 1-epimerase n=1 Tax=Aquipuribacter nitratireducens TaxID=650104 RepID=A0ABW0GX25_9MICO